MAHELKVCPCRFCEDEDGMRVIYPYGPRPAAGYLEKNRARALEAPLFQSATAICETCGYLQEATTVARDILVERIYANYQPTYSMSTQVSTYVEGFLRHLMNLAEIKMGDLAIEIGSNDGSALKLLQDKGLKTVGFEPAQGVSTLARKYGLEIIETYFGAESAAELLNTHQRAKLIFTRHTLEHDFTPLSFLSGIATALDDDGLAVIEVPYAPLQMMTGQPWLSTLQHQSCFTVASLDHGLRKVGLVMIDIDFVTMDGGSMVAYVRKAGGNTNSESVARLLALEEIMGLTSTAPYERFFEDLDRIRSQVGKHIRGIVANGAAVVAYGAGGKGQALLNLLGLDYKLVPYVVDDVPGNAGRFVPGMGNEVISSDDEPARNADVVLITAPTHIQEIVNKEKYRWGLKRQFLATSPNVHYVVHTGFNN